MTDKQKAGGMIRIDLKQAEELVLLFGGDGAVVVLTQEDGDEAHSGPGLYAHLEDYPDEGSQWLGLVDD